MNSNNFLLRSIRVLLFPAAVVYGIIIKVRNWLYYKQYYKSIQFNLPIINVGNLSVGGTGKSPMVAYLVQQLLALQYKPAILSRGYKRRTVGYILATPSTTALDVGDEPMLLHNQFPYVPVAVGESRVLAVPQLLQDAPSTQVIVLDDAMQHRAIIPSYNILLTECSNLYVHDYYLPTGDLRDQKSSSHRAQCILVTKCNAALTTTQRNSIITQLSPLPTQQVYFTTIVYGTLTALLQPTTTMLIPVMDVLVVTGIANPTPMEQYIEQQVASYEKLQFADHHIFTIKDIRHIEKAFDNIKNTRKIIVTTQKDAIRLLKFGHTIAHLPIYVLPITIQFLFEQEAQFVHHIKEHISTFKS